jgi:hypothetical protein
MGGLVAMMAAQTIHPDAIVLLEPSPPAEVGGLRPAVPIRRGSFDPEQAYGPFPPGVRARPESAVVRAERARGISVPRLPCPSLLVSGTDFPEERGSAVAAFYGSQHASFPTLDQWDLVLRPEVRETVRRLTGA